MNLRFLPGCSLSCLLAACGGGGGGGAPPAPPPVATPPPGPVVPGPVLPNPPDGSPPELAFSLDQPFVLYGGSATVTWKSTGSACTASGGWSGSKATSGSETLGPLTQTSDYVMTCDGIAPYRAVTGTVRVRVEGTAAPAPTSGKVYSRFNRGSLDFVQSPALDVRDLLWDAAHGVFHVLTRGTSANYPGSLVTLDTNGAIVRTAPLGSEPSTLALSAQARYVYVGFTDGRGIRRLDTATLGNALDIPITGGIAQVVRIAGAPGDEASFAVLARNLPGMQSDQLGLMVFDGAVPRPNVLAGTVSFGGQNVLLELQKLLDYRSDSLIYASASAPRGLLEVRVDAQGLSLTRVRPELFVTSGHLSSSRLYADDGRVLDTAGPVGQLGTFNDGPLGDPATAPLVARVENAASGKAFELAAHVTAGNPDGTMIVAYDLDSYETLDSISFNGVSAFNPPSGKLITWGTDGLAFGGLEGVVIAKGSFAQPGGKPPTDDYQIPALADSTAIQITDPVTRNYDEYRYRVYDVGATDAPQRTCGRFFFTASRRGIRPNRIVQVGSDGFMITSAPGGSGPDRVAFSVDCAKIFVGQSGSDSIRRIDKDMSLDAVIPVDSQFRDGRLSRAAAIAPAFGSALTFAVARAALESAVCDAQDRGLVIIDDLNARPVSYDASPHRLQSLAWGPDANTLFATDETQTSVFTVDASGARDPHPLFPYPLPSASHDLYGSVQFDRYLARLYDGFGSVFDTTANRSIGPLQLRTPASVASSGCAAPTAAMTFDQFGEKLFWVRGTEVGGLDVESYDARTLTLLSSMTLPPEDIGRPTFGLPKRLFNIGSFQLALITDRGYLVVIESLRLR